MPSCQQKIKRTFILKQEPGGVFSISAIAVRAGCIILEARGEKSYEIFKPEAGGHRWQRIPPTERRGRVHTSTITIAVLKRSECSEADLKKGDLKFKATRGSGKGGQNRNKVSTAIQLTHEPSGIQIRSEDSNSQKQNRKSAETKLRKKLNKAAKEKAKEEANQERINQIGTGWRGGKIRTIRVRDGIVTNHSNNKTMSFKRYERGYIEEVA